MKATALFAGGAALCILFVVMGLPWAGSTTEKSPSADLPENRYDFGTIGEGIEISHAFTIMNKGSALLTIEPAQNG